MEPHSTERNLIMSPALSGAAYGFSEGDEAHILGLLRNTLYADKVLAVMREYGTNAMDAHVDAGIPERPIQISVPTMLSPHFIVRDFGKGLSEEDVYGIFVRYGRSTKRKSNSLVGCLGLGSKSAFAYTDTFTITSYHGGMKSVYVSVLDETGIGKCSKLFETPCEEETGVEISIPVKSNDFREFYSRLFVYKWFNPKPICNKPIPDPFEDKVKPFDCGFIHRSCGWSAWVAVMGGVEYKIQVQQVTLSPALQKFCSHVKGGVYLPIGAASVSASREELEYTERTKAALVDALTRLRDEMQAHYTEELELKPHTDWEIRKLLWDAVKQGFEYTEGKYVDYSRKTLVNDRKPEGDFEFWVGRFDYSLSLASAIDTHIDIGESSHIVLMDKGSLRHMRVSSGAIICTSKQHAARKGPANVGELREAVERWLRSQRLTGIPISLMTELVYDPPMRKYTQSSKGRHQRFHLSAKDSFPQPFSQYWNINTETPSEEDVYVLLSEYRPLDENSSLYAEYLDDQRLFDVLKVDFPKIIGYKNTQSRPINKADLPGTSYVEWRKQTMQACLANPTMREKLEEMAWQELCYVFIPNSYKNKNFEKIGLELGPTHIIAQFLKKVDLSHWNHNTAIGRFNAAAPEGTKLEAFRVYDTIQKRYPLLGQGADLIRRITDYEYHRKWCDYVKGQDLLSALTQTGEK